MNNKIDKFNEMCGMWDFRNIDMTKPHLSSIEIKNNTIFLYCEIFSPALDDYIDCYACKIKDKELLKMFKNLDLSDNSAVSDMIGYFEMEIDWDLVSDKLSEKLEKEIDKVGKENLFDY